MTQNPSQPQRLAGKVAIVTGASRGLGRAIALALGREGAAVAVAARSESVWNEALPGTVHETAAELQALGAKAIAVPCDASREDDLVRLVETTRAELGPVGVLINNAAVTAPGRPPTAGSPPVAPKSAEAPGVRGAQAQAMTLSFLDMALKGFRLHFDVGVFASYRLMQLVLPDMIAAGRGAIVNISSWASRVPGEGPYPPGMGGVSPAYGGNKAALEHLTQTVASLVAAKGVAVNGLIPSLPIITPGLAVLQNDFAETSTEEAFAEATIRLCLADPAVTAGQIAFHDDVLHPELGRRGWLGAPAF
jgi:NAD(P)-dependent dehydrogenase (short-subunit alcohol dehydrogenase family)